MAIISTGENKDGSASGLHPILFKVGDGAHKFDDLPFASALAADVYAWAKQSEEDFVKTFLALHMNDGTTMQAKLDAVFATDAELSTAIENLRKEIPAELGVMSVTGQDAIKCEGDADVKVSLALDNSGNVKLSQSNTGLKANIDLSEYAKTAELPDVTASGDGEVILSAEGHHVSGSHATHAKGSAKTNSFGVSNYGATGTIYVPKIETNEAGHVTSITEETVTISIPAVVDTNTVTTVEGDGKYIKVDATVNTSDAKNYKVSLIEDEIKTLIGQETTAAMEFKGAVSALPAGGNKGDMYKVSGKFEVSADKDAQGVGFTAEIGDSIVLDSKDGKWYHIPSGDDIEDTWRPVTGVNTDSTLTFKADEKLDVEVKASEQDQDLSGYKTLQEEKTFTGSTIKTVTSVTQDKNGEMNVGFEEIAFPAFPELPDEDDFGVLSVSGDEGIEVDNTDPQNPIVKIADKGVTTAKIADHAVGAHQTKACKDYEDNADAEIWVFYCGSATELV